MVAPPDILDLVIGLGVVSTRIASAERLAALLGADRLHLFVRDPVIGSLIPAPGFPQTVRGGRSWKSFLAGCRLPGRCTGEVDLPAGTMRRAVGLVGHDLAIILIGGLPTETALVELERLVPLVAATLASEQRAVIAIGEAVEARNAASRAHALADALEAARADASRLNAELREEHRRKDDFLAMLAHELRNPLAPLTTSVEILQRRAAEFPGMANQLAVMARQLDQLSRLVGDLLDVARVDRGRIVLRKERVAIGAALADAIEATRPLIDLRDHALSLSIGESLLEVDGDRARLVQVFSNLLNNAAKYTEPGGSIAVAAERDGAWVTVRITDAGLGIAVEMQPRIFDLFTQAPVTLDRAQGGLGIGLTLVRAIVELHRGRVSVASDGVGRGSVFTVALPLAVGARAVPAREQPAMRSSAVLRILVVDDNQDAADMLCEMVESLGHQARVAYSAISALQIAADLDADLVLLDIGLPEMDGFEVARRMRSTLRPNTRLVALTGYGDDDSKRRTRSAGFDEHFTKPLTFDMLLAVLAQTV